MIDNTTSVFGKIKGGIVAGLVFLFPLFFLTTTQEFFLTNKLYFLAVGALLLVLVSLVEFLVTKKIVWRKGLFDNALLLFILAIVLSTVITSTNKVQAILNPNFGLLLFVSLGILYVYASRRRLTFLLPVFYLSSAVVSVLTVFFYFNPLKNITLPVGWEFLKSSSFNTFGNQIDLAIFLGFAVSMILAHLAILFRARQTDSTEATSPLMRSFYMVSLAVSSVAFFLTLYSLYTYFKTSAIILPPLRLSWYAAVEILKNPVTALFGIGVDNFSVIFTQVKDLTYNQSSLWQTSYFTVARSGILHILSETGILGLLSFVLLLLVAFKNIDFRKSRRLNPLLLPGFFMLAVLLLLPPSLTVFFLLIVFFTLFTPEKETQKEQTFDLSTILPLYLSVLLVSLIVIGAVGYLLGRSYMAEYMFDQSLNAITKNNARDLYNGQQNAIILNPYIERFHINFAQTNLLLANNVAQRALQQSQAKNPKPGTAPTIDDQDRQIIGQGIQTAISEAKAAVSLNPQKSSNWENLALIYRNVLSVAQGADVWTISSYQRAILADPQNPVDRLNLGGVYYSLNNFNQALALFSQAVTLKPDWANAHYNLAWTAFQMKDYQTAASEMQTVLTLLDPKTDQTDVDRAQKDLEQFKKLLPSQNQTTGNQTQTVPQQLALPSPAPTLEPKIKLPKEASPEAK